MHKSLNSSSHFEKLVPSIQYERKVEKVSRGFLRRSHCQVIKAARCLVEWCSNNLCATELQGWGHPGINYVDVGGGLALNLKLWMSVMFLSKEDFPLIHTFISPCSPGWCLITAVHCFFLFSVTDNFLPLYEDSAHSIKIHWGWKNKGLINEYQGKSRTRVESNCCYVECFKFSMLLHKKRKSLCESVCLSLIRSHWFFIKLFTEQCLLYSPHHCIIKSNLLLSVWHTSASCQACVSSGYLYSSREEAEKN